MNVMAQPSRFSVRPGALGRAHRRLHQADCLFNQPWPTSRLAWLLCLAFLAGLSARSVQAQAPGLLWRTNVGARLFAVDAQTNVYANQNATIIALDSTGAAFQTNTLCSVTNAIAQRDGQGNLYLAGSFDGTQDFGGITLVGGWTNYYNDQGQHWTPGYPTCYLAKYDSHHSLQWAVSFGPQGYRNHLDDLAVNDSGSSVAG